MKNNDTKVIVDISKLNEAGRVTVGGNLRKIRQTLGITQKKLAETVGLSRQAIGNYEQNNGEKFKRGFKLDELEKIVDALSALSVGRLSISVSDLISW